MSDKTDKSKTIEEWVKQLKSKKIVSTPLTNEAMFRALCRPPSHPRASR